MPDIVVKTKTHGNATYYYVIAQVTKGATWPFVYSVTSASAPLSATMTIATDYEVTPSLTLDGSISSDSTSYTVSYSMSASQCTVLGVAVYKFSSEETFADGTIKKKIIGELTIKSSVEIEL